MHIGFQRSGGRGEYEVVSTHSGYTALSLEGWTFSLAWPDGIVRETDLWLDPAGSGKPRLRSLRASQFQIGRMVAAMLLLPDPIRDPDETGKDLPVVRRKDYSLSRVGFGPETQFAELAELVTIQPSFVRLSNQVDSTDIGIDKRWTRIQAVYLSISLFPPRVQRQVELHRDFMASGDPVDANLVGIVKRLGTELEKVLPAFKSDMDPLPALETLADITPSDAPELPPPDELGEDEPEVSARSAYQYRLAKVRGPGHQQFSIAVREAYGHRCVFCGGVYGGVPGVRSGLEAAHILAWSKYDADVLPNGMSLCKTHHWAFDAALMVPEFASGQYRLRFTKLSQEFEPDSMSLLGEDGFVIPDAWLPVDKSHRPSKKHLDILYEDLAISFID